MPTRLAAKTSGSKLLLEWGGQSSGRACGSRARERRSRRWQRTGLDGEAALEAFDAQAFKDGELGDRVLDGCEGGEADVQHAQLPQAQQWLRQAVVCVVVLGRQAHFLRVSCL